MAARPRQSPTPTGPESNSLQTTSPTRGLRSASASLATGGSRQINLPRFAADPRTAPSTKGRTYDQTHAAPRPGNPVPGAAVGRPKKTVGNFLFYGYPPELIARWCGVSEHTAYLYKIGARKLSRQALRLFTLHRDGRVLGPEWRDWAIRKDRLVSPEAQETTQNQLAAYWLIMQLARELAYKDPEAREEFNRLLRSA